MHLEKDHIVIPVLLICLVAWRVVRRIRHNTGRHLVRPGRMTFRIVLFSLITILLAGVSHHQTRSMLGLAGGLAAGALVGLFGVHLTRFETTGEGTFFLPNTYLGIAVSFLLVARLMYRVTLLYAVANETENKEPAFVLTPFTLFTFGLLAGYYITYYLGIFIRSDRHNVAQTNA
jgi:hypothetical protein